MTKILVVIAGFIAGGAIVTGTALALNGTQSSATASMAMTDVMGAASSTPAMAKLTIQHVQKGCHVWSNGSLRSASMRLNLKRGARLQILDQDIDPHGLVQVGGPKLAFIGHMMMGERQTITFKQPGVYRLKNKVIKMGSMPEVKTIGPDNTLRLTVTVR
jgi:hypothetical protein